MFLYGQPVIPVISTALTLCSVAVTVDGRWPNPDKDPLVYIANPIEAEMPGHWVPVSVVKVILEKDPPTTQRTNIKMHLHGHKPESPAKNINTAKHKNSADNKKTAKHKNTSKNKKPAKNKNTAKNKHTAKNKETFKQTFSPVFHHIKPPKPTAASYDDGNSKSASGSHPAYEKPINDGSEESLEIKETVQSEVSEEDEMEEQEEQDEDEDEEVDDEDDKEKEGTEEIIDNPQTSEDPPDPNDDNGNSQEDDPVKSESESPEKSISEEKLPPKKKPRRRPKDDRVNNNI